MNRSLRLILAVAVCVASAQALAMHRGQSLLDPQATPELGLASRADAGLYAGLLASVPTAFVSASLLATPTAGGVLVAQDSAPEVEPPAAPANRQQLLAEYADLEASRPGLAMPIVLLVLSVVTYAGAQVAYGLAYTTTAAVGAAAVGTMATVGLVLILASAAFGILGTALLIRAIVMRVVKGRRMGEIDDQLKAMDARGPAPAAIRLEGQRLEPQLVVASF